MKYSDAFKNVKKWNSIQCVQYVLSLPAEFGEFLAVQAIQSIVFRLTIDLNEFSHLRHKNIGQFYSGKQAYCKDCEE